MLTQESLKKALHYDPATGVFTRIGASSHNAGGGSVNRKVGYRYISVLGKSYLAHRLAFLYMTGNWPINQVDHIDGNRLNNQWSNLRDVPPKSNMENLRVAQINNALGYLGVSYAAHRRGTKKYVAQLTSNGKRVHNSYHYSAEEAHAAYLEAKRRHRQANTL